MSFPSFIFLIYQKKTPEVFSRVKYPIIYFILVFSNWSYNSSAVVPAGTSTFLAKLCSSWLLSWAVALSYPFGLRFLPPPSFRLSFPSRRFRVHYWALRCWWIPTLQVACTRLYRGLLAEDYPQTLPNSLVHRIPSVTLPWSPLTSPLVPS